MATLDGLEFTLTLGQFVSWTLHQKGEGCSNVTRLGDFWKFLVTYFFSEVAQIFIDFWGYFENIRLK